MYNIALDEKKKTHLDYALSIYLEELENIMNACTSRKLKDGFQEKVNEVGNLLYIVRQTDDKPMADAVLCAQVADYLQRGDKIGAIKFVREQRSLGLKEAKDYVDAFQVNLAAKK